MPSYITHAIASEQLYELLHNDKKVFIDFPVDSFKTYSVVPNFTYLNKKFIEHTNKDKDYILIMSKNIKDNKLFFNEEILAYIYGFISNLSLDYQLNPLINSLSTNLKSNHKLLNSRFIIEKYFDSYLTKKISDSDIGPSFFNHGHLNDKDLNNFVNNNYKTIFNNENIIKEYKKYLFMLTIFELNKKYLLRKDNNELFNIKDFMKKNHVKENDLLHFSNSNNNHSFIDYYDKGLTMAEDLIIAINSYIYQGKPFAYLEKIINSLSFNEKHNISYQNIKSYTK